MTGPARGTTNIYPPAEIARVALIAQDLGLSMATAVSVHFNVTPTNARSLIARARTYGFDIPSQVGWNGGVYERYTKPQQATCPSPGAYKRHLFDGEEPCSECKRDHAERAKRYRQAGSEKPAFEPSEYVQPVRYAIRLMCDCGAVFPGVPELTRHTVAAHGRAPSKQERTPT